MQVYCQVRLSHNLKAQKIVQTYFIKDGYKHKHIVWPNRRTY